MSREHHHRPATGLKQSNKSHRGHSKGQLRDAAKGRVPRPHPKSAAKTSTQSKADRRNHAKQLQQQKRQALFTNNRAPSAPRVVVCIALTEDVEVAKTTKQLFGDSLVQEGQMQSMSISHPKPAQLQVVCPPLDNLYDCLDVCAAADYVLILLSPSVEVGHLGETLLRSLCAMGVPEHGVRGIICGDAAPTPDIRRSLLSYSQHFFGHSLSRLYAAGEEGEASNLLRSLCEAAPKGIAWREERARILSEQAEWREDGKELHLTGVVRGASMSANRLVHLPGIGDCQVDKILAAPRRRDRHGKAPAMDCEMDDQLILSEHLDGEADDLQSLNSIDPLDELQNEQTWPTEEELVDASLHSGSMHERIPDAVEGTTPRLKKVPKGTSQYQAAWILESDESATEDEGDMQQDGIFADPESDVLDDDKHTDLLSGNADDDDVEEFELLDQNAASGPSSSAKAVSFAEEDVSDTDLDTLAVEKERKRWRAARDEEEFPDEIDTPLHIPARERFARYRGLKSFRTSPWDPYENLPDDYAKIFMFRNWRAVGRSVVRQEAEDEAAIQPGTRVTVIIRMPEELSRKDSPLPVALWALHKHEHKVSVAHCSVLRNTEFEDDVRSKESLILQVGPRRYHVNPLFSQHTQANSGKGSNNVHKFERFLPKDQSGAPSIATVYLPVTFGTTVPTLFFRDSEEEQGPTFVGAGVLHSCDPTRIVAKRIVLTGHPVRVHKKTATIRYLFFNPEDVAYFKPVQLRTKKGRTGYIRESLGTHGLLKAGFDGPLQQTDTVCLNLYKRVYPKQWSEPVTGYRTLLQGEDADVMT